MDQEKFPIELTAEQLDLLYLALGMACGVTSRFSPNHPDLIDGFKRFDKQIYDLFEDIKHQQKHLCFPSKKSS